MADVQPASVHPETLTVNEGSGANTGNLLTGDTPSNVTGSTLSVSSVDGQPAEDSIQGEYGLLAYTGTNGQYTYTPTVRSLQPEQSAAENFQVNVADSGTGQTQATTLTVTVDGALVQPVVNPETLTVGQGSGANPGNLLTGDLPSNVSGSTLSITGIKDIYGNTANPTVGTTVQGQYGILTFTGTNGQYTYTPTVTNLQAGQSDTDTFQVTVADSGTGNTATVPLTVTIDQTSPPPPTIKGTMAGQQTSNDASIPPFAQATINDSNANSTDTLTIQLTSGGNATAANGTLVESGGQPALTSDGDGLYTLAAGSASDVQNELRAVVFAPTAGAAGSSTTTGFTLTDMSSAGTTTTDSTTTVTDTDSGGVPMVTGGTANQQTTNEATVNGVFQGVTVTDPNAGTPTETVTITVGGSGGTLMGATPGTTANTYQLSGTVAQVNAALSQISFTPTAGQPGSSNTTTFSIIDKSSADATASTADTTPSVVDTDTATPPTNPTITGLSPVTTALQDAMQPFGSATVSDPVSGALDSITITPSGAAGALAGSGLTANPNGTYTLAFASPQTITQELDALTFTPAITNSGPVEAMTFALALQSTSGASSSASTAYTVNSTPNHGDFGTTTTSATSPQGEVYALYEGLLARAPDPVGGETAVADLQSGAPLDQLTQSLLVSAEGSSYFTPNSSNGDFVNQLYERVLGRVDTYQEQAYWDQTLANGASRADVADDFVFSAEHENDIQPALSQGVFVADAATSDTARLYYGLLDRSPDAGGLAANTGQLDSTMSLTGLAQSFLNSSEYAADNPVPPSNQAFVNALFENALGRAPDPGGYWVQQLDSGAETRAQVTVGIAESAEAQQHLVGRIETGYHIA